METGFAALDHFNRWSEDMRECRDMDSRKEYFQQELPGFLSERSLFVPALESIVNGRPYPDVRSATMFDSEIVLFRDPGRAFSVRFYLWGPGDHDPIHDHNSWGVIGAALGTLDIVNYRRLDDGSDERHAVLEETSRQLVPAGQTSSISPLDRCIHRTGNASDPAVIQVGVYGENLTGRSYVNIFDIRTGDVKRLYLPHVKKRILARQALDSL